MASECYRLEHVRQCAHGDIAAYLHDLMTKTLGFHKFTAQGGDWVAEVASAIGRKYPASLCGVHQNRAAPLNCNLHEYSALAEMKKGGHFAPTALADEIQHFFRQPR